ncbi:NAD(P)-dependent oxidoreductase [Caulobacter hibisci]|uniref:NAD(P)-dependent oxidoreductase n=1 Tax=Caulobacter hibisci TaxID=2035993 RepID=A0ABS0SXE9_9CAUL|nr:NAD(P)-dependent oxidoreductase [Caulobacter hibisci]MBI1684288.1 NAD(P)-dependent oxidoreductase [Caulobacter hibisci]
MSPRLALIGFGEVGQTLHADLVAAGITDIVVHDRLLADPHSGPSRAAETAGARTAPDIASTCLDRDLVVSAVTAGEALNVARAAAPHLGEAFFLDLNSVAPQTRQAQAALIERYVEAAVMAPIAPRRIKTPVLLGGPHATATLPLLERLGFSAEVFGETVGGPSAVKLSRSIFVKGLEAIVTESLASARHYGVEAQVLASLSNTIPHADWPALARYLVTRPLVHGQRRSEEMAEAALMLEAAGLPSPMAQATVEVHARQGSLGLAAAQDQAAQLGDLLDAIEQRTTALTRQRKT